MTPRFRLLKRRAIALALNARLDEQDIDRILATRDTQELMSVADTIEALAVLAPHTTKEGK